MDMTIPDCIQKRGVRTIPKSKYNSHTEPVSEQQNITKLPDLYKLELYKLHYQIENKQVPNSFTTIINPLAHHYNTRRPAIQQPKTTHAFAQHNCIILYDRSDQKITHHKVTSCNMS